MACKCSVLYSEYSLTMFMTQFKFCFLYRPTLASALALRTFLFVFSRCFFNILHYYVFHIIIFTLLLCPSQTVNPRNKRTLFNIYIHSTIILNKHKLNIYLSIAHEYASL